MKIILSSIILILFISNSFFAQNIPNPSFEAWTPSGSEPPFDWQEPTNWKSNNAALEFSGAAISQTDDAYEGEFSVSLTTANLFEEIVPGMLVNGNPTVDFSTYTVNVETGGTPLSDLTDWTNSPPVQMNGFYKFSTTAVFDSAFVVVLLTKFNSETNQIDTAAYGKELLAPSDDFSSFAVSINELNPNIDPDNIIVAFYSTNPNNPQFSGHLIVDQLGFNFLPSAVSESSIALEKMQVFPNPIVDQLQINCQGFSTEKTIEVYSVYGKLIKTIHTSNNLITINFKTWNSGIYLVRIFDKNHRFIEMKRVEKV